MSNSSLVDFTRLSPNFTKVKNKKNKKITIHHVAGIASVEQLGAIFVKPERRGSSNYGIGNDGRIGMYVEEKDRAWTSGSYENDSQAITIEVSNCEIGGQWRVNDKVLAKLIDLCVDICKRNGIEKLNYTGNKNGNLTEHNYFQATACPGQYLKSKLPYIANEVNKRLVGEKMSKYFKDVKSNAWYADEVDYCKEKGLMNGTTNTTFEPERTVTRAELAVVLERLHKKLKG